VPALLIFLAALVVAGCGGGSSTAGGPGAERIEVPGAPICNGSASLCSKRIDQVIFPGTHNSYAASDQPGWHFATQRYGIGRQLDDGIRALLLDVHYGVPNGDGLVRTDFAAEGADANKVTQAMPPGALRAAERIAGPLGAGMPSGKPRLYLCHTLCELGAEPLAPELAKIHAFLEAEPGAVLILVMEDYVPAKRIAAAFREAGLTRFVATLPRHGGQPTLGHLVLERERLVVFSEKGGGTPAWYMPAFDYIQDTPLGAHRPDQLSCERFRGEPDSPLLLINHWIPPWPPSPRLNALIGRRSFLRGRIRRCMDARGFEGAIVAVDFYDTTSVVRVAEELNR
jgi:hypothetical protein